MIAVADGVIFSLVAGIFVGLSAGYIGSLMVLKRMALAGDALSHVALPGLALGTLFNFNPFLGAFAFLFSSAVAAWYLEKSTKLSIEAVIGIMFTLSLAIGILIMPQADLLEALFGDIAKVGPVDALAAVAISVASVVLTGVIYKKIILSVISEELVAAARNMRKVNLVYLLIVSLIIAVGIKIVGTLLVGAMVIVPAASAKNLSSNLFRYSVLSSVFGAASSFGGIVLSAYLKISAGPLVVLAGMAIFMASLAVSRLKPAN